MGSGPHSCQTSLGLWSIIFSSFYLFNDISFQGGSNTQPSDTFCSLSSSLPSFSLPSLSFPSSLSLSLLPFLLLPLFVCIGYLLCAEYDAKDSGLPFYKTGQNTHACKHTTTHTHLSLILCSPLATTLYHFLFSFKIFSCIVCCMFHSHKCFVLGFFWVKPFF